MIVSGNNSRSISTQKDGIFEFVANFPNDVGGFDLGLSGSEFFGIKCENGFVSINDNLVTTINNQSKRFKINYSQTHYDLYVDNINIVKGATKSTDSYEHLITNSTEALSVESFVSGKEPLLVSNVLNNSTIGSGIVTGVLYNSYPERRFRIFDARIDSNFSSKFRVDSFDTGWNGEIFTFNLIGLENEPTDVSGVKINFDSNFGKFSRNVNITTDADYGTTFFEISPDQDTYFTSVGSKLFEINSFFQGPSRNLQVEFEYISGGLSDQLVSLESGFVSGNFSGFLKGCGSITGDVTNYLTNVTGLSGYIFSGNATGQASQAFCHTGEIIFPTTVTYSGLVESGVNMGQVYTEEHEVILSGTVLDGSGYYLFNEQLTSGNLTGNVNETGWLYSTAGHTAGIGSKEIEEIITAEICADYEGAGYLYSDEDYYYNIDGWSGIVSANFTGYHIPTGTYTTTIVGIGSGQIPNSENFASGVISGEVYRDIINDSGCDHWTGTVSKIVSYVDSGCLESGHRLVGVQEADTSFWGCDPYSSECQGTDYYYNFSDSREYLQGSGLPCKVYLSGYAYEGYVDEYTPLDAPPITLINIELRHRVGDVLIGNYTLDEDVRTVVYSGLYGEDVYRNIRRVEVPELENVDLTGDINIIGHYRSTGESGSYSNSSLNLTLIPSMMGPISGTTPIYLDYEHSGCLTGNACIQMTGSVDGDISGVYTLLRGTGIGSGYMRGPLVPVDFSDMWNLKTGIGQFIYDYKESGWVTAGKSGKFANETGAAMPMNQGLLYNPFIEVYYNRGLNNETSIGKLSVFDGYNSGEIYISGL